MKFTAGTFAILVVGIYGLPAFAHHSFAMFDAQKKVTLDGTVKEFQWTNPHSWILMTVGNDNWSIELDGPSYLVKNGWLPKTLTPGMKVTAIIRPMKNGRHYGRLLALTLPNGVEKANPNVESGSSSRTN